MEVLFQKSHGAIFTIDRIVGIVDGNSEWRLTCRSWKSRTFLKCLLCFYAWFFLPSNRPMPDKCNLNSFSFSLLFFTFHSNCFGVLKERKEPENSQFNALSFCMLNFIKVKHEYFLGMHFAMPPNPKTKRNKSIIFIWIIFFRLWPIFSTVKAQFLILYEFSLRVQKSSRSWLGALFFGQETEKISRKI